MKPDVIKDLSRSYIVATKQLEKIVTLITCTSITCTDTKISE